VPARVTFKREVVQKNAWQLTSNLL
jgi:hypothetical protein